MANHIGETIKRMREERGLSKARLAREAFITDPYLLQIERGDRNPSEKVLRALARAMSIPASALLIPAGAYDEEMQRMAEAWAAQDAEEYIARYGEPPTDAQRERFLSDALEHARAQLAPQSEEELELGFSPETYLRTRGPEGWNDLSKRDQRLVQQLVNRLRPVVGPED